MVPINESDLDEEETQLENLIQQFSTNMAVLERCKREWTTLLTELPLPKGEEKMAKEKQYLSDADSNNVLIKLLLDSNKMVTRLQGQLAQVLRK